MTKLGWNEIDDLVRESSIPLNNEWLDSLVVGIEENISTRWNYYRFLYHLTLAIKPEVCLELGVEFGIASAYMALAAKTYGGMVVGVDLASHGIPAKVIPEKLGNYTLIVGDSIKKFNDVAKLIGKKKIGVVLQDSSHHFVPSCMEWELYKTLLADNAVWVCDDITPSFYNVDTDPPGKGMVQYFESLPGDKRVYKEVLDHGNAMGVLLR